VYSEIAHFTLQWVLTLQLPILNVIVNIKCTTFTGVHAPAAFHKCHLSSSPWLVSSWGWQRDQVCTKILLEVHTRPAAITLNYSVLSIQNDVQCMTYDTYIYTEKIRRSTH